MRDFPDFACMPYISLISLSIGSYLELAIFREDFSPAASVNVRFSWVFYFVFICSGYILNSPHYIMGGMPRPVFIRGFPDFLKSRFLSRILVCWIQWGRERRITLKRFVTVVAWKFLKISCLLKERLQILSQNRKSWVVPNISFSKVPCIQILCSILESP